MDTKTYVQLVEIFSTLPHEDIREAWEMLRNRYKSLARKSMYNFGVGAKVQFKSKYGMMVKGVVTKINRTTVSVRAESGTSSVNWRVNPAVLKKQEEETMEV